MSLAMSVGVIGLWCTGLWCAPVSAAQSLPLPHECRTAGALRRGSHPEAARTAAYSLWSNTTTADTGSASLHLFRFTTIPVSSSTPDLRFRTSFRSRCGPSLRRASTAPRNCFG